MIHEYPIKILSRSLKIFSPVFELSQDLSTNVVVHLGNLSRYILCRERVRPPTLALNEGRAHGLTLITSFRPTAINITFYKPPNRTGPVSRW